MNIQNLSWKFTKKEFNSILEESDNQKSFENLKKLFSSSKKYFENNVYQKYIIEDLIQNKIDVELIYPASEKQIKKYTLFISKKTLPFINSIQQKRYSMDL